MTIEPEVVPLDRLTAEELREAFQASRIASRSLSGNELSDLVRAAPEAVSAALSVQTKSVDTLVTAEIAHGVVGAEEIEAAHEVADRVSGRLTREQLEEHRKKIEAEQKRQHEAYIEVQRSPRNHIERRKKRLNPHWTRDGVSPEMLGVKPKVKGTKSTKSPKRKRKKGR